MAAPNPVWQELQEKYLKTDSVNQLIFVKYLCGSTAYLELYLKDIKEQKWDMILRCDARVGKNGIGKTKEGDKKTPLGDYGVTMAMGFLPDPGTKMDYMLMDEHTFTTDDKRYYNQLLDDREVVGIAQEDDYMTTVQFAVVKEAIDMETKENNGKRLLTKEELEKITGGTASFASDNVTVSYVIQGKTYTTTFKVSDTTLSNLLKTPTFQCGSDMTKAGTFNF